MRRRGGGPIACAHLASNRDQFGTGYREALDGAAQTLTLDQLEAFLEHWRRVAWSQDNMGHHRWRAMLTHAEHTMRTGERPPGAVSMEETQARIQARLADA